MKRLTLLFIAIAGLLGFTWAIAATQGNSFTLDWWTVDGGGGRSDGGNLALHGTIGQPEAGAPLSGGTLTLDGGFWGIAGQGQPLPIVSITLTPLNPPITIPPQGGSYQYEVLITNNSDSSQTFDVWLQITAPNGASRTLGPVSATLQPGQSLHPTLTQQVPGFAPAGTYSHAGFVGDFPNTIVDSDSFTWDKAAGAAQGPVVPDWGNSLDEWQE